MMSEIARKIDLQLGVSIASIVSTLMLVFSVAWWGSDITSRVGQLEVVVDTHRNRPAHNQMQQDFVEFRVLMNTNLENIRRTLSDILRAVQVQRTE